MRAILIETSTERGLIAITENDQVIAAIELPIGLNQSKYLMPELQKLFATHSITSDSIQCIGVGVGPGSYTGIRIGVAVAKSLAYAWNIPLIGFSSLYAYIPEERDVTFASLIDAKIGGAYLYTGKINIDGMLQILTEPQACPLDQLHKQLDHIHLIISPTIKFLKGKVDQLHPDAQWHWQERAPSPIHLARLVNEKYRLKEWSLNGHLELLYLRKTQAELERLAEGDPH